jgi:hypothetical protein
MSGPGEGIVGDRQIRDPLVFRSSSRVNRLRLISVPRLCVDGEEDK